ncbi:MAG: amino acid permease [Pseudomonadales bacterium]|nr:amino acid permease [Pseudomonadales bacterium]
MIVLYGLGTTIGAGIYALLGEIAQTSGMMAPWAFLVAASLALLTALSFARMVHRYPKAAGAALYVQNGFGSKRLGLMCGLIVIFAGLVSSAALLNGLVGYAQAFIYLDRSTIILIAVSAIGLVVCWGINLSVWVAGIITLLEIGGLMWGATLASAEVANLNLTFSAALDSLFPTSLLSSGPIILSGAILAFYAFIGFEDLVEVAEEVKDASNTLPLAIVTTLVISTLLYLFLVTSAVLAVGPTYLAQSNAPLSDLITRLTTVDPRYMSAIGVLAISNGALIQVIMASRVLYGLGSRGQIPTFLAKVNKFTKTPVIATGLCISIVVTLSLTGTVAKLTKTTSLLILIVFMLVNLALVFDERRTTKPNPFVQWQAGVAALVCAFLAIVAVMETLTPVDG